MTRTYYIWTITYQLILFYRLLLCYDSGVFPYIGEDGKPDYDFWKRHEEQGKKITVTIEAGYGQYKKQ